MGYQHQGQYPPPVFQNQQDHPYANGYNNLPPNYAQYSYPQQPPPPAAYYYQQHYTHVQRGGGCYRCFCCCICFILLIVIVVELIIFINWLILRPYLPTFRVTSMCSTLNLTKPLRAEWIFNVTVDNTKKGATVYLDDPDSSIFYDDVNIGKNKVARSSVKKGEMKNITVHIRSIEMPEGLESSIRYDMDNELKVRGSVKFKFGFHVEAELKGKLTRKPVITLDCEDLDVKFSTTLQGESKGELDPEKQYECEVNTFVLAFGKEFERYLSG